MASSSRRSALTTRSSRAKISRSNSTARNTGSAKARNRATPSPASSRNWARLRQPLRRRLNKIFRAMQEFLEYVVKGLVQNPGAVTVTPVERAGVTVYELRLDPGDVGKIIGRQGITINAIRSLLLAGSAKKGLRCSVEIVEDSPAS